MFYIGVAEGILIKGPHYEICFSSKLSGENALTLWCHLRRSYWIKGSLEYGASVVDERLRFYQLL